jgi:hypothetical protein
MIAKNNKYRDPVRPLNMEFLQNLELVSDKIHPLPGAMGGRLNVNDPRISDDAKKTSQEVCFYEHLATIRHKPDSTYYVAFRETMDAFLARQMDFDKYPKWLMNDRQKQAERQIYIYFVKAHPKTIPIIRSHEDWLKPIENPDIFDCVAHFLTKHGIITDKILNTLV